MLNELRAGRIHLLSGIIMIVVYLAGVASAVGFFAWMRPPLPHHQGPWSIVRGLDLTAEQDTKVRAIIDRHHTEVEATMRESFPKLRASRNQAFDDIRALLDESQAKRFDARRTELEERGPGLPPFGPPPWPPHSERIP